MDDLFGSNEQVPATRSKDWTGNKKSTYVTLGASSHSKEDRQADDYYATEPTAAELLLSLETLAHDIWEPACGEGHLSEVFSRAGHTVKSTDLIDRGYGVPGINFLSEQEPYSGDIVTNPPYKYAEEFVVKGLALIPDGNKVCMFLKLTFLESVGRRELFRNYPPRTVYVASARLACAKNGDFKALKDGGGSAAAYAWFVWEKGYQGETILKWFN